MVFICSYFEFILRMDFRELRNGKFFFSKKKKKSFFVELLSTLHIYRSAAEIIYDPDTTNDDP